MLRNQLLRLQPSIRRSRPHLNNLRAQRSCRSLLYLRSVVRHHDDGLRPQRPRRIGHTLRVVAARVRNHSAPQSLRRQLRDHVVGSAQLEASNRLLALRLDIQIELRLRKLPHLQPRPLHAIKRRPHRNSGNPFLRRPNLIQRHKLAHRSPLLPLRSMHLRIRSIIIGEEHR